MNQQKTLLSIACNILLELLAKDVLNFESLNALDYFCKCADTQNQPIYGNIPLWNCLRNDIWEKPIVNVLILIKPMFSGNLALWNGFKNDTYEPTVDGFLKWNSNNTYHVVHQLVFTYAIAIMINKLGECNNNENIQSAGRYKFWELFYGFNHPIYQEIEYCDHRQKVAMPYIVKKQRTKNLTYTISKNPNKHQGGDFILEGKVHWQKVLASKGVDLEKMRREVARNLDDIDEVSKILNKKLSHHEIGSSRNVSIKFEIILWRALLQHTGYLLEQKGKNLTFSI